MVKNVKGGGYMISDISDISDIRDIPFKIYRGEISCLHHFLKKKRF
jgi:hypothetical protein